MRGASRASLILENVLGALPGWRTFFFRTSAGAELDLVLEKGKCRIAVECKASSAPTVTRRFSSALEDLRIDEAWVVAAVTSAFPLGSGVEAVPLSDFLSSAPRR